MASLRDWLSGIYAKIDTSSQALRVTNYNTDGSLVRNMDGVSRTYSASITALTVAAAATDFFTITGSATEQVRILKITINGIATTAISQNINFIKRSTANETGTATTLICVPYDSSDSAATAVVKAYTVSPESLGTSVGQISSPKLFLSTSATEATTLTMLFGDRTGKGVVLRGVNESLCLNYNGATNAGNSLSISVEFVEEKIVAV